MCVACCLPDYLTFTTYYLLLTITTYYLLLTTYYLLLRRRARGCWSLRACSNGYLRMARAYSLAAVRHSKYS